MSGQWASGSQCRGRRHRPVRCIGRTTRRLVRSKFAVVAIFL
jgi:hypothetical protein